jgi:uncharacterized protein (TIGR03067 family)
MLRYVLVIPVVALLVGADKPTGDVKNERKMFQGEWVPVSLEINGERVAREAFQSTQITFKGQSVTRKSKDQTVRATFTIDPSKNPKWFDATAVHEGREVKSVGIYKFERGRLTLCTRYNAAGKRPTEFSSKGGTKESQIVVVVLERPEVLKKRSPSSSRLGDKSK